jgi:hypothetical protein
LQPESVRFSTRCGTDHLATPCSNEFNRDIGRSKRIEDAGPVIVTDRETPAFVLLCVAPLCRSRRLNGHGGASILDWQDYSDSAEIEVEPSRLRREISPKFRWRDT